MAGRCSASAVADLISEVRQQCVAHLPSARQPTVNDSFHRLRIRSVVSGVIEPRLAGGRRSDIRFGFKSKLFAQVDDPWQQLLVVLDRGRQNVLCHRCPPCSTWTPSFTSACSGERRRSMTAYIAFATWPLYRKLRGRLMRYPTVSALLMTLLLSAAFILPALWMGALLRTEVGVAIASVTSQIKAGSLALPDFIRSMPWVGD